MVDSVYIVYIPVYSVYAIYRGYNIGHALDMYIDVYIQHRTCI